MIRWPPAKHSKESKFLVLETSCVFSLGATTDAKDYLRNFNLLEAKRNPATHSYREYNHAVHK